MKDQINTIRSELTSLHGIVGDLSEALTALTQLEAMVGEPVAWLYESPMPDGSVFVGASAERLKIGIGVTPDSKEYPLYRAAPVAQQPQAKSSWLTDSKQTIERQFAEFLNDRRSMNVSAVFHEVMRKFAELVAPQQAEAVPPDVVRDAGRYRWLRSQWFTLGASYPDGTVQFHLGNKRWSEQPESNLDTAIDAAIAQQKGGA